MNGVSTVASRRSVVNLQGISWGAQGVQLILDQGLKQRLITMRMRRAAREKAGLLGCPNLYRLSSRRKHLRQRTQEQRAMAHWFASKGIEYTPQIRHMLSPVHTPEDELAQVHLSGCLARTSVVVGLESQCKNGAIAVAI